MSNDGTKQYIRKASLRVVQTNPPDFKVTTEAGSSQHATQQAIDLSEMHFTFTVTNQDEEAPNNCMARVFNLKPSTVQSLLRAEYSIMYIEAGYEGSYGIIFQGDVIQFRVGRLNETDTYLDILAADGDFGYNQATIAATLSAIQNTTAGIAKAVDDAMKGTGVTVDPDLLKTQASPSGGITSGFRGKVAIGLARSTMTTLAKTLGGTWSINDGVIRFVRLDGYVPGEAVVLNQGTGLIGMPEQTQDGIKCQCLINPKIQIGGRVQINSQLINRTIGSVGKNAGGIIGVQTRYNSYGKPETYANITRDGIYRVYICEHVGDTRGPQWYTNLTLLAIDATSEQVIYGGEDL